MNVRLYYAHDNLAMYMNGRLVWNGPEWDFDEHELLNALDIPHSIGEASKYDEDDDWDYEWPSDEAEVPK